MKAVVIRCPNCGTTQGELGTCDTCHEAEVGYYCPNHAPGRWIDGPECDACGARFGVEAPPVTGPVASPRAGTPPTERRPVNWRPPGRTRSAGAPPTRSRRPAEPDEPVRDPDDVGELDPRVAGRLDPVFVEWLEHMRRTGRPATDRPPAGGEGAPWTPIDPAAAARGVARGAFGCIGRLVMIIIVFAILAMLAMGGFFGGYADLDDVRLRASSSAHASDRHALHLDALPHPRQGRLDLRPGA